MEQPTNSQFLAELARGASNGTWLFVCGFHGDPNAHKAWGGEPYRPNGEIERRVDTWGDRNTYFCVGGLKALPGEESPSRKKTHFTRLLALVVDDVDVSSLMASPSWVLETSPGKSQAGIFIDADCDDAANADLVTALVTRMHAKGLVGDKAGNNQVRWVRLPQGTNQKPRATGHHQHRLLQWSPSVRMTLEDAAATVGVDLDALKAELLERQETGARMSTGLAADATRQDRVTLLTRNIMAGENLHDSLAQLAAAKVATGMAGGAIVEDLRGLMQASPASRDERWQERYDDIPRAVATAQDKYGSTASRPVVVMDTPDEVHEASSDPSLLVPEHLMKPGGMIQRMAEWMNATAIRPQPILDLAASISLCATALGRQVAGPLGSRPALYIVCSAKTASGKEHGRKKIAEALVAADLAHLIGPDELASDSGLESVLREQPALLFRPDEYGIELQAMTGDRAAPHKKAIVSLQMRLWGLTSSVYSCKAYADRKARPGGVIHHPVLNIYGTTTEEKLWPALSSEDAASGFMNRILFFFSGDRPAKRDPVEAPVPPDVVEWLRAAAALSGASGNLGNASGGDPARARYAPLAKQQMAAFDEWVEGQMNAKDNALGDLYGRASEYAERLAVVGACAKLTAVELTQAANAKELEIDPGVCGWAIALVKHLVTSVVSRASERLGGSDFERHVMEAARLIKRAGRRGATEAEMNRDSRPLRALKDSDLEQVFRSIKRRELAFLQEMVLLNGRKRCAWVAGEHRDYYEELARRAAGGNLGGATG